MSGNQAREDLRVAREDRARQVTLLEGRPRDRSGLSLLEEERERVWLGHGAREWSSVRQSWGDGAAELPPSVVSPHSWLGTWLPRVGMTFSSLSHRWSLEFSPRACQCRVELPGFLLKTRRAYISLALVFQLCCLEHM